MYDREQTMQNPVVTALSLRDKDGPVLNALIHSAAGNNAPTLGNTVFLLHRYTLSQKKFNRARRGHHCQPAKGRDLPMSGGQSASHCQHAANMPHGFAEALMHE